jgi:hypothetical protein
MKNFIIVVAIALFTLNVSATENPIKPSEELRTEIVDLIGYESPFDFENKEYTVEVIFTVNSKSEIIVIYSNSPNLETEKFIKGKLNYKKVNYKVTKEGELYLLPLKFKKA